VPYWTLLPGTRVGFIEKGDTMIPLGVAAAVGRVLEMSLSITPVAPDVLGSHQVEAEDGTLRA